MARMKTLLTALSSSALLLLGGSGATGQNAPETSLSPFTSAAQMRLFANKMQVIQQSDYSGEGEYAYEVALDAPAVMAVAEAASDAASYELAPQNERTESITNTQEAGVDEGAIVKNAGDYFIVLRRGRIFTVRHGGDALEAVAAIDAFPPGAVNPGQTWYDEMLVRGNQVIVIGYSYGDFGTEINRFTLGDDGSLAYRDTHYLRSGDYYSSENYASRLIGDELIVYAPVQIDWRDWRSSMPAIRGGGPRAEAVNLVDWDDMYVAAPYRSGRFYLSQAHTITRCNLAAERFDCSATAVLGSWGHSFYVSPNAAYVWTEALSRDRRGLGKDEVTAGQLFRLPLDGSAPGAVAVSGSPANQFSFREDTARGLLYVALRGDGSGDGMWAGQAAGGDLGLASITLSSFGNGARSMPREALRRLPGGYGNGFENRFAGDYLLYAPGHPYRREGQRQPATVHLVPLDGGPLQSIALAHDVTRFDIMGADAVAIGPDNAGALGFSAVSLGARTRLEALYLLPAADEGESRSQAFFYRADDGSPGGVSGMLGLPVSRGEHIRGELVPGSDRTAIFFLRRNNRAFSPGGELVSGANLQRPDGCVASCVDWYGNARPIFLGGRVFALLGYELVEGAVADGRIAERRRINFQPVVR